jgi:hypothetical protein
VNRAWGTAAGGDGVLLGNADEQKEAKPDTV